MQIQIPVKKAVVCITAYDRLELLEQCLSHLSRNDHSLFDVWVFPDHVSKDVESEMSEICTRASRSGMSVVLHHTSEERIGCCRNIMRSLAVSFIHPGDYIIKLDSDILVTKDFVKVMLALSESRDGGLVTSPTICHLSKEEKQRNSSKVVDISLCGANFCVSQKWWREIEETAWPLVQRMKSISPEQRNHDAEWQELKEIASKCNPTHPGAIAARDYFFKDDHNTASDAIIVLGAAVCDCPISSLVVNRAIHPSAGGVHTTPEWHAANYANTFLDEIECDDTRTVFEY